MSHVQRFTMNVNNICCKQELKIVKIAVKTKNSSENWGRGSRDKDGGWGSRGRRKERIKMDYVDVLVL